ncbi:hypothetical protein WMY93_024208 [Mugilogobius chulae]|uniref:Uncharacterized protein n=1 Tax=Mugilogobius chulae TaxID=88201 RepID=A0AAW0N0J0_9GOBI
MSILHVRTVFSNHKDCQDQLISRPESTSGSVQLDQVKNVPTVTSQDSCSCTEQSRLWPDSLPSPHTVSASESHNVRTTGVQATVSTKDSSTETEDAWFKLSSRIFKAVPAELQQRPSKRRRFETDQDEEIKPELC